MRFNCCTRNFNTQFYFDFDFGENPISFCPFLSPFLTYRFLDYGTDCDSSTNKPDGIQPNENTFSLLGSFCERFHCGRVGKAFVELMNMTFSRRLIIRACDLDERTQDKIEGPVSGQTNERQSLQTSNYS